MKRIKVRKNNIILPIILDSSYASNYLSKTGGASGQFYLPWKAGACYMAAHVIIKCVMKLNEYYNKQMALISLTHMVTNIMI
jgi:hypothetical protein